MSETERPSTARGEARADLATTPTMHRLAAAIVAAIFLGIYLPDLGHGFIQDDFRWIASSRFADAADVLALFRQNVGFYRPLVSLTFGIDQVVWALNPFGYGITNLFLLGVDAWLLFLLARRLRLPVEAALLATAVWIFNFHGVNMALLWISGRTSLLVTMFALLTTAAALRRRLLLAGGLCLGALLCKEEAAMLPAFITAWVLLEARLTGDPLRGTAVRTWPLWLALGVYAWLRSQSGAFGPVNAPSYYQFTFDPMAIAGNVLAYADRAATVALLVVLMIAIAIGFRRLAFDDPGRRVLRLAALWVPFTYALTLFLPVRSSLYALLPSIGTSLAVGAVAAAALQANPRRFRQVALALLLLVALLIPVYRARNQRWVRLADRSAAVLHVIRPSLGEGTSGALVLVDDPADRFNLRSAFGTLLPDALSLLAAPGWTGMILLPGEQVPETATLVFALRNGEVTRLTPSP